MAGRDGFRIVMTPVGVRAVTDPDTLSVMDMLAERDMSLAELSREIDVAPSSLFFQMEKLMENGLVTKSRAGQSKKTTRYALSCRTIIESAPRIDISRDVTPEIMKCILASDSGVVRSTAPWVLGAYMASIGVDVQTVMYDYGRFAAEVFGERLAGPHPEDVLRNTAAFLRGADGTVIDVCSAEPPTVIIHPPHHVYSARGVAVYAGVIAGALSAAGVQWKPVIGDAVYGPSGSVRVVFGPVDGAFDMSAALRGAKEDGERIGMCVCEGGSRTFVVESDAQVLLLSVLEERPMCITEILAKLDMPRSTAASNLQKLQDMGAVDQLVSGCGTACYCLTCNPVLKRQKPSAEHVDVRNGIAERLSSGPGAFSECLLMYSMYALGRLGFDSGGLMRCFGSRIGDYLLLSRGETHSDEAALADWVGKMVGVSISVVNAVPPVIRVSKETGIGAYTRAALMFYSAALSKILTGIEFHQYGRTVQMKATDDRIVLYETINLVYPPLHRPGRQG